MAISLKIIPSQPSGNNNHQDKWLLGISQSSQDSNAASENEEIISLKELKFYFENDAIHIQLGDKKLPLQEIKKVKLQDCVFQLETTTEANSVSFHNRLKDLISSINGQVIDYPVKKHAYEINNAVIGVNVEPSGLFFLEKNLDLYLQERTDESDSSLLSFLDNHDVIPPRDSFEFKEGELLQAEENYKNSDSNSTLDRNILKDLDIE